MIEYIGESDELFAELMEYFFGDDMRVVQLTSWAVGHIGEIRPQLIAPYHKPMVEKLAERDNPNAIRRNITRLYQYVDIPEEIEGSLYDLCMEIMLDHSDAIAQRAFAMRVCERIAEKHPDLIPELQIAIGSILDNASAGLKNRGNNTLKRLEKKSSPWRY